MGILTVMLASIAWGSLMSATIGDPTLMMLASFVGGVGIGLIWLKAGWL